MAILSMDEYYNNALAALSGNYATQESQYDTQKQNDISTLEKVKNEQAANLLNDKTYNEGIIKKNLDTALMQAYYNQMMAKKEMPMLLAAQGINGGMTESAFGSLEANYQNGRRTANDTYNTNYTDLGRTYNTNLSGMNNKYTTDLNSINSAYAQNMSNLSAQKRNDALVYAQNAYQRDYQQALLDEQQRQFDAQLAAAKGGGGGGGGASYTNEAEKRTQTPYNAKTTNDYAWQNSGSYKTPSVANAYQSGLRPQAQQTPYNRKW